MRYLKHKAEDIDSLLRCIENTALTMQESKSKLKLIKDGIKSIREDLEQLEFLYN